jgi:hypothetical protein
MCLLLAPGFQGFFFLFWMQPLTVLMKQTWLAVCTIKQSIYLDVFGFNANCFVKIKLSQTQPLHLYSFGNLDFTQALA